jgi:tetratricopeptide (TPR) repeat protein
MRAAGMAGALAFALMTVPAIASGGGGGGGGGGGSSGSGGGGSEPVHTCPKKGEVWKNGKCVKRTGAIPDGDLYAQGRQLALDGQYEAALDLLHAVHNQRDPMVLTMIGYSKRKLGDMDGGFAAYKEALAIDPDNLNTHEYMGEAYVTIGKVGEAKLELATLRKLCGGAGCEQYDDLAKALNGEPDDD